MFTLADEAQKELFCSFFGGRDGDECVLVSGICETSPNMQFDL